MKSLSPYLKTTYFLDADHPAIIQYTKEKTEEALTPTEKVVALYYAIRDGFWYNPSKVSLKKEDLKASQLLTKEAGYCVEKSNLLATCARVLGIPSRLSFSNVTNHLGTAKLEKILKTNILVFHGCAELYLDDKWIKATPVFNKELCEKLGVAPLPFNGKEDAIFQAYDRSGNKYMEYLHDYGHFADLPFALMVQEWKKYYGHLIEDETDMLVFNI
ncbi:MAG: transglutaminase family protein [Thermonemataceae bacterium]